MKVRYPVHEITRPDIRFVYQINYLSFDVMRSVVWATKCVGLIAALVSPLLFSCSSKSPDVQPTPVDTLGTGWRKISMPDSNGFADIFFINNNTGYVVGAGIFRSTDGGSNWQKVNNGTVPGIVNIAMGSESNGVFVTGSFQILFTKDGGASFGSVNVNDNIQDAFFVNATTVYAVGDKFWKSTDAGSTWTKIYDFPPGSGYRSLHFLNDQYGWVAGSGGPFRTINGGIAWEQKTHPEFNFLWGSAFFNDTNNGYVSDGGRVFKTSNSGNAWTKVFTGTGGYQDLHFTSTTTGYFTEGNYIYKTTDGGSTWNKVVVLPKKTMVELHFTDASHGWACGDGIVLKYQN